MLDLKYDTDVMRQTAVNYSEAAATMLELGTELERQIADLKSTYWRSEAGEEFQNLYKNDWMKSVEKYAAVLQELSNELQHAAGDYDTVTEKLRRIEGISV